MFECLIAYAKTHIKYLVFLHAVYVKSVTERLFRLLVPSCHSDILLVIERENQLVG
jgi:hypothetical protein